MGVSSSTNRSGDKLDAVIEGHEHIGQKVERLSEKVDGGDRNLKPHIDNRSMRPPPDERIALQQTLAEVSATALAIHHASQSASTGDNAAADDWATCCVPDFRCCDQGVGIV